MMMSDRMPDERSPEEQCLVTKASIAKVKTATGLAKQKNSLSAKKKDLLSKDMVYPLKS